MKKRNYGGIIRGVIVHSGMVLTRFPPVSKDRPFYVFTMPSFRGLSQSPHQEAQPPHPTTNSRFGTSLPLRGTSSPLRGTSLPLQETSSPLRRTLRPHETYLKAQKSAKCQAMAMCQHTNKQEAQAASRTADPLREERQTSLPEGSVQCLIHPYVIHGNS